MLRLLLSVTILWGGVCAPLLASQPGPADGDLSAGKFVNPIAEGADPWVVADRESGRYLWCQSDGNRAVAIWVSNRLTTMGTRHVVWQAPETGPFSQQIWAPELHRIEGRWFIYLAASDGENANHLTYVLASAGDDPLGPYELHGPLATGAGEDGTSPNVWSIDMTVLEHRGQRYALWSGWDAPGTDQQYLYIAPMKSPVELAGPRVRMCANDDYLWERTEERADSRGLHEGPQVLKHAGRVFVTYSTAASWLPTYKLGLLELVGDDPLDPAAWKKFDKPVFAGDAATYGVGHSCFVESLDGKEWWHVYHAKRDRQPGWRRGIHIQPFGFTPEGLPDFGKPVAAGVPLNVPSGERATGVKLPYTDPLTGSEVRGEWDYYGHHQFLAATPQGVHLGREPSRPVNEYRSGEKLLLGGGDWQDVAAEVTLEWVDGQRDGGIVFRVTAPGVGYDAQRGYMAAVVPAEGLVVLGRTDGQQWTELARQRAEIDPSGGHRLRVVAIGDRLRVLLDGNEVLEVEDGTYRRGTVGLRVVDSEVRFRDFRAAEAGKSASE